MEKKLTAKEAEAIQDARDVRRTKLFKEFCRELSELPEEFQVGSKLDDEMLKKHLEPMANRLYQYMKANDMSAGDIEHVKRAFELVFGYTLTRVTNFAAALVSNAMLKHFGVSDVITDLSLQRLEDEGLVMIKPEEME